MWTGSNILEIILLLVLGAGVLFDGGLGAELALLILQLLQPLRLRGRLQRGLRLVFFAEGLQHIILGLLGRLLHFVDHLLGRLLDLFDDLLQAAAVVVVTGVPSPADQGGGVLGSAGTSGTCGGDMCRYRGRRGR